MVKGIKKIALLTGGGDCPGLNAVIRAATKTAIIKYGVEVVGFVNGYKGLYNGNIMNLDMDAISGILPRGGTILYTSNKTNLFRMPFKENGETIYKDLSDVGVKNIKEAGIDALIIIGGDGTLTSARDFARKGVKVIGVPKTIDNDLAYTDITFGFDTAVSVATDAIDRLHTTAESHHRIMCLEVMGRYAGWIALEAGLAGGADAILIPEIPYDINKVAAKIQERRAAGKDFSIIVVAEGAKPLSGDMVVQKLIEDSPDPVRLGGIANKVAADLEEIVGLESRATILGHLQRGGTPTSYDRNLSTRYGKAAVDLVFSGKFAEMVTLKGNTMSSASLEEVIGKSKNVDPEGEMVNTAKSIGIAFGD
ncbi:ATP-dependent 6-phosphofructokinase [Iocasia frigidifontis]|uniref:ATP-dependent 6-phosphofructokinase n=1 Tax=Iocasia fonsfrigidae TaxID=2682810 RepID=A0A8A7KG47_9FIRM|nr:6-phosphofructokinase [Iocasia fonsfrigidae]QTL98489.1 ATP-dependent 6-phosphofructokinase [Iocasia fonsfrigidae]